MVHNDDVPRKRKSRINFTSTATKYADPKHIGKTIVSLYHPSTIDHYWFLVNPNTILNTFDFVTVNNLQNTRIIGIIQDLTVEVIDTSTTNYLYESYFHEASGNQQPNSINTMPHDGIIAKVAIIGNTGVMDPMNDELISLNFPVRAGNNVRFSTKDEVLFSMGVPIILCPLVAGNY